MAAANALITWNKLQLVKRGQRKVRSPGDPPEINVSLLALKNGRKHVACLSLPALFWIHIKLKGSYRIRIRIKVVSWIRIGTDPHQFADDKPKCMEY
jgi:hypothetical protein